MLKLLSTYPFRLVTFSWKLFEVRQTILISMRVGFWRNIYNLFLLVTILGWYFMFNVEVI